MTKLGCFENFHAHVLIAALIEMNEIIFREQCWQFLWGNFGSYPLNSHMAMPKQSAFLECWSTFTPSPVHLPPC